MRAAVGRRRPDEPSALQPLRIQRHAEPVVPEDLDQVTSFAPENIEIARVRIAPQRLLNLQGQAAAAHVRPADRQPHPHPARNRDHRRSRTVITAAASSGGIHAGMRTRESPENSIVSAGRAASMGGMAGEAAQLVAVAPTTIDDRRHDRLGKSVRQANLPPPPVDQAGTDIGLARHVRHPSTGRECRSDKRPLLLFTPPPRRSGPVMT